MRRGARWALVVGAAVAAVTAAGGAGAEIRPIVLDECSWNCNLNAVDDLTGTRAAAEVKITLSVCGGGRGDNDPARSALVLDLKGMPAVLAGGLPSPIAPDGRLTSPARSPPPYLDVDSLINGQHPIGAPAEASAASFVLPASGPAGGFNLTDILSYLNTFFATWRLQRPAL